MEDVRRYPLSPVTLILILDVLQYLDRDEQLGLLEGCARNLEDGGKLIFRVQDEERGIFSHFSMALDRIVFALGRAGRRPLMLTFEEYRRVLEDAGLAVRHVRFRNRLPLAHLLVIATKRTVSGQPLPEGRGADQSRDGVPPGPGAVSPYDPESGSSLP